MIAGIVLKNYKCYKGIHFIPLMKSSPEHLKLIIGNNGVGKSAILEALDSYFNDKEWIIHTDLSKKEANIGVFFLMEKEKSEKIINSSRDIDILKGINDAFWGINISENANYSKYYTPFFDFRDTIKSFEDTHYFFLIGKEYNDKGFNFLTFQNSIVSKIKDIEHYSLSSLNQILITIINHYSYLYIPVESSVSDFLRLEAKGMQILMDKDIKNTISQSLNEKRITRTNKSRKKQIAVLDIINENLESYVSLIQEQIQKIDNEYNFKKDRRQSTKLTANHITDVIVETYYAKRKLKKGTKSINVLSSGEKRRALIDIAYAFISQSSNTEKELILAIDEPESSLHISRCFEQFSRIQEIATKYSKTVFLTTHWYGSLPILQSGSLVHIDNKEPLFSIFELANYFEERREHPDDIQFKSFFDLASSILASLRDADFHWLLVEGLEDKIYIEHYLDVEKLKIKILPLGGCSNVKKIYEYLFVPLSSKKKEEVNGNNKKIFCLVDTDRNNPEISVDSETKNKLLQIRRLQEDESHNISLLKINNPNNYPTEIEDSLEADKFYSALSSCINTYAQEDEKNIFDMFDFDTNVQISRIDGDYSILSYKGGSKPIREAKEVIRNFIDNNKEKIAQAYISNTGEKKTPGWITEIESFFRS
ncbi:ATP-binding protein [Bacteroidales bacterium OttesenSCG-928-C19]|nr:ATP-binding protein [Bacteroidales bacterium OttesenSCG-928-C19]